MKVPASMRSGVCPKIALACGRTDLSIRNVLTNAEKTFEIFPYEERTLLHINSLLWCSYIAHLGPLHSCSKNSIREQFYILCSRSKVHI